MTDPGTIFADGVRGGPKIILHAEGATVLTAAVLAYAQTGASWWLFAALFLAPDLGMLGYLAGRGIGAACYNAVHNYVAPGLLMGASILLHAHLAPFVLIWVAHIGFDRLMGYGLKYRTAFGDTHLGQVGRTRG